MTECETSKQKLTLCLERISELKINCSGLDPLRDMTTIPC